MSDFYRRDKLASMHLVMGCPNGRAGVRIAKKLPLEQLEQPIF